MKTGVNMVKIVFIANEVYKSKSKNGKDEKWCHDRHIITENYQIIVNF